MMNSIKHNSQYVEFKNYVSIIIGIIISHLMFVNIHDYIEKHKNKGDKYKEWIATWGLLVSLVWLYTEILRLMRTFAIKF